MINYSEATEQNSLLVALDQEKVYDKIHHDYLLKILKNYNLPDRFTKMVESLCKDTETVVVINGTISNSFKVSRGVHQGDPLSCLQ